MAARKRTAKPIEIALTEEQIEGIIAEAAARAGRSPAHASAEGFSFGGAGETASGASGGAGVAGFGVPLPGDGLFSEVRPAAGGFHPRREGPAGPAAGDAPSADDRRAMEEHRRNVIRQLRGVGE